MPFIILVRYPSLRVAYIEEKDEIKSNNLQTVYSSILIKAVNKLDQVIFLSFPVYNSLHKDNFSGLSEIDKKYGEVRLYTSTCSQALHAF